MVIIRPGVDITNLKSQFWSDVHTMLAGSPYTWHITSGYRSNEEQAKLYDKYKNGGAKAAPPGKSAHNVGLAIDVAADFNGQESWNMTLKSWAWLFLAIWKHPRLHSGKWFGDPDHIERYNWKLHTDET